MVSPGATRYCFPPDLITAYITPPELKTNHDYTGSAAGASTQAFNRSNASLLQSVLEVRFSYADRLFQANLENPKAWGTRLEPVAARILQKSIPTSKQRKDPKIEITMSIDYLYPKRQLTATAVHRLKA
jgi:hypothetical protein